MKLNRYEVDNATVLELTGDLMGGPDARIVSSTLEEMAEEGVRNVVIDLENVTMINSSGLSMLIAGFKTLSSHDGKLLLANPTEKITKLLEMTKLNQVFNTFDSVETAVESLE